MTEPTAPPRLGRPLAGIRVLDLSRLLPGPWCSLLLADLGAEVIKVETPLAGDYARMAPAELGFGGLFEAVNRGKRSIAVNYRLPRGREIVLRLAATADVFLEASMPGQLARRGLGEAAIRAVNPRIVYCSLSGYGQAGPYRDRPGHDLDYLAIGGLLALLGPAGRRARSRRASSSPTWRAGRWPRWRSWPRSSGASEPARAPSWTWRSSTRSRAGWGRWAPARPRPGSSPGPLARGLPVLRGLPRRGRRLPGARRPRAAVLGRLLPGGGSRGPGAAPVRFRRPFPTSPRSWRRGRARRGSRTSATTPASPRSTPRPRRAATPTSAPGAWSPARATPCTWCRRCARRRAAARRGARTRRRAGDADERPAPGLGDDTLGGAGGRGLSGRRGPRSPRGRRRGGAGDRRRRRPGRPASARCSPAWRSAARSRPGSPRQAGRFGARGAARPAPFATRPRPRRSRGR